MLAAASGFLGFAAAATTTNMVQETTPTPITTPFPATADPFSTMEPEETPIATIDRLAPPPTVISPTQADEGAYLYWLHCQPCHGDRGQGLTDEWRMQYPEAEQNCWQSGCHGNNPYEGGFRVPTVVPAVIGDGSLARFATMGDVFEYIRVAMPLSFPGTLTEAEYLALTAYLARAHGVWDGRTLDATNVHELALPFATAQAATSAGFVDEPVNQANVRTPTPEPVVSPIDADSTAVGNHQAAGLEDGLQLSLPVVLFIALLAVGVVGGLGLWLRHR